MFSRFCKLCRNRTDTAIVNLKRHRLQRPVLEEQADQIPQLPKKDKQRIAIIKCKRPEFNFYKGTTYSKFEVIPLASKGWHHRDSIGDYFTINPIFNEEEEVQDEINSFEEFNLHPKLIENLKDANIYTPTKIQKIGIPLISVGQHTTLSAETGCGKTLTFLLPILNRILRWKMLKLNEERPMNCPYGLIITPSKELAHQIGTVAKIISRDLGIDIKVQTGGRTKQKMLNPSVRNVDLLIGTFGIISKMSSTRIYQLGHVKHVVLDEAHALFHETFDEKLEVFLRRINFHPGGIDEVSEFPVGTQLTLVSATKPSEMPDYLNNILDITSLTEATTSNFHHVLVPQKFLRLRPGDKPSTLLKIVKPKAMARQQVIIFSNDSTTCDWIKFFLNEFNVKTIHVNGEMHAMIRKGQFAAFQNGEYTVLSTTNAGARGLDTVGVNNVINYELPLETADYIHRCGRTGRIGTRGDCKVTNFVSRPLEVEVTKKIERAARRMRPIPIFNMVEEHEKMKEREANSPFAKSSKPRVSKSQRRGRRKTAVEKLLDVD